MNQSVLNVLSEPLWQQITLVLIHFAWQAVVVALIVASLFSIVPSQNAALRFRLAMFGMLLFALCPLVTFFLVRPPATEQISQAAFTAEIAEPATQVVEAEISPDSEVQPWSADGSEPGSGSAVEPVAEVAKTSGEQRQPSEVLATSGTTKPSRWQPYVIAAWLAGVCLLSLRLVFSSLSTYWLRCRRRSLPADLKQRMNVLTRRMRIPRARAFISNRVRQAMVVGILRPCILIPASWLTQLTPEALEAVLAHELAHLRRHDLWAVLFQRLIETLFFYHPAVWWLSRRIDIERELACDDWAVAATGQRLLYAQSLERVARQRLAGVQPALAATIQGERKMKLLRRVRHVLGAESKSGKGRWWPVGLLVLLVALGVWGATTDAFTGGNVAVADDEGEKRDGDREGGEREVRRDGDRERGEREVRRDGDREGGEREVRRDGDREREGDRPIRRDGDREREEVRRDGDRREGDRPEIRRDGERREGDRRGFDGPPPSPRERALMQMLEQLRREVQMLRQEVQQMRGRPPVRREGDRPEIRREGDRPPIRREGDRPELRREGDRPPIRRDGDRPDVRREGDRPDARREGGDRPVIRREGERDRPPVIRREGEREGGPDRPREGDREKPRGEGDRG